MFGSEWGKKNVEFGDFCCLFGFLCVLVMVVGGCWGLYRGVGELVIVGPMWLVVLFFIFYT